MSKTNFELVRFGCDNPSCEKTTEVRRKIGEPFDYPYKDGWVFLYAFNWKHAPIKEKSVKRGTQFPPLEILQTKGLIQDYSDKHFCSRQCLISWLSNVIREVKPKPNGKKKT